MAAWPHQEAAFQMMGGMLVPVCTTKPVSQSKKCFLTMQESCCRPSYSQSKGVKAAFHRAALPEAGKPQQCGFNNNKALQQPLLALLFLLNPLRLPRKLPPTWQLASTSGCCCWCCLTACHPQVLACLQGPNLLLHLSSPCPLPAAGQPAPTPRRHHHQKTWHRPPSPAPCHLLA